jgi:hypothetical protein
MTIGSAACVAEVADERAGLVKRWASAETPTAVLLDRGLSKDIN